MRRLIAIALIATLAFGPVAWAGDPPAADTATHDGSKWVAGSIKEKASAGFAGLPSWLKGMTPAEAYAFVEAELDSITSLAEAKAKLRLLLPLLTAGMIYLAQHQRVRD